MFHYKASLQSFFNTEISLFLHYFFTILKAAAQTTAYLFSILDRNCLVLSFFG